MNFAVARISLDTMSLFDTKSTAVMERTGTRQRERIMVLWWTSLSHGLYCELVDESPVVLLVEMRKMREIHGNNYP